MQNYFGKLLFKVHYVLLSAGSIIYPNYKKWFHKITKQINFYSFIEDIIYHLLLVVIVWLVKMLKIVKKLGKLYNFTTIS